MSDLQKNSLGDSHQFDSIAMKQHLQREEYLQNYVSIDLEVSPKSGRIEKFAAVHASNNQFLTCNVNNLALDLARLDEFVDGASFILGHNIIEHDIPYLKVANPNLSLLGLPVIDTLRLSPLAFPENPYHHLVKHYKDGGLRRTKKSDPKLDAEIAIELFDYEFEDFKLVSPDLLAAWHWLTTNQCAQQDVAMDVFFSEVRTASRPIEAEARRAIANRLRDSACATPSGAILSSSMLDKWALAYALAWLSVAGGKSTMPPWVCHQFPNAEKLIYQLRNFNCRSASCSWCRENHDAHKLLMRWFKLPDFRQFPADENGKSRQQSIVEKSMAGEHVLAKLPTGTGKSLCYQLPALSRYDKTGALTVVISPLVALMADQIHSLEKSGINSCATINGMLSMPERSDALEKVRLGEVSILLISPEQLRSRSVINAIKQRRIGGWVMDEAHCLSKWGHDFRPDYRYVGRFIKEKSKNRIIPNIMCLTATARPEVTGDIVDHFKDWLDIDLTVCDGGAERSNLDFEVIQTSPDRKFSHIYSVLESHLPSDIPGGAIVYCATRQQCELVAEDLIERGVAAHYYHAGLSPEIKKDVQQRFTDSGGDLRVVVATNAFGMGIDKPDVRLVVHADIPGSLENYLQEAGRAGRDQINARCVLLFTEEDAERQFGMAARSRLTRLQIHSVLRALRKLNRKETLDGDVVATAGEILDEDEDHGFVRDSATDDTRVRTAIAWLEESELLTREENNVQVFPSSLKVSSIDEASKKLTKASLDGNYCKKLLAIVEALMSAAPTKGISTDDLMDLTGLSRDRIKGALFDLERLGVSANDTQLTVFVHFGVKQHSKKRFKQSSNLESALIDYMRELAPNQDKGEGSILNLRHASQSLRDDGLENSLPEKLWRIIRSISYDGQDESNKTGSLSVKKLDLETCRVTLRRDWRNLNQIADMRRQAASRLLDHLLDCLPSGKTGVDIPVRTTIGKLHDALITDLLLKNSTKNSMKLMERALLWLHEQDVIRLNRGLTVFRPAMTIRLIEQSRRRGFASTDFIPLDIHYKGQVRQIHFMIAYAELGIEAMSEAIRMAMDYFALNEEQFLQRWLPNRNRKGLDLETTPESWQKIVAVLKNPVQHRIVADMRENTNVLVLAGPGSGKTRVLVHRIAYLIRVKRQEARGIIAIAYNRHVVVEIRRRLYDLVGKEDARRVIVLTCHGLAMRLAGVSFKKMANQPTKADFNKVINQAVSVLQGDGLHSEEAEEQRARLLAGFRWILVDEYQDINKERYELISALAGRTLADESRKLTLFAVGDDDQNIYSFDHTSVEFIRRFQSDYGPSPTYLIENYRSTINIISAANVVIERARRRMKKDEPIRINRARAKEMPGGEWKELDSVSEGRVQIINTDLDSQAVVAIQELQRLAKLDANWDWSKCAVIARNWECLDAVRACCDNKKLPVQMGNEDFSNFMQLRETRDFMASLEGENNRLICTDDLNVAIDASKPNRWSALLQQAIEEFREESIEDETTVRHFIDWFREWTVEIRRRQRELLLVTAHSAKGLEFDHVVVLDGNWNQFSENDPDESIRLYYVAMTRARKMLILLKTGNNHPIQNGLNNKSFVLQRKVSNVGKNERKVGFHKYETSPKDVDLGFAGRFSSKNSIHHTIASLNTGDTLTTRFNQKGVMELMNPDGVVIGRLSKGFTHPPRMRCYAAKVYAIINRQGDSAAAEYRDTVKCDNWEVVLPELIYEREK